MGVWGEWGRRCRERIYFGSGFFEHFEIMLFGVKKICEPICIVFQRESVLLSALMVTIRVCGWETG